MTKDTLTKVGREGSQFYLIPRPDIWPGNEARPIWDQTFATKHSLHQHPSDMVTVYFNFPGFIDQEKDAAPVWWLESSSYPIEILDKKKVRVLVRSDELKRRYKHDAVIISFEWGKGVVYHMISHFYLQRSETRTKKQGVSGMCSIITCTYSYQVTSIFNEKLYFA